jgi:hypothetical protein
MPRASGFHQAVCRTARKCRHCGGHRGKERGLYCTKCARIMRALHASSTRLVIHRSGSGAVTTRPTRHDCGLWVELQAGCFMKRALLCG